MTKVAAIKGDAYDPHIVGQAITDLLAVQLPIHE